MTTLTAIASCNVHDQGSNPAATATSYLFPGSHGLVVVESPALVTVMVPATGWVSKLTGELARDAAALLSSNEKSARLEALGDSHLGVRTLLQLASQTSVIATAEAALRLEGFDTLFVELVGRCNERCSHCYAGSGPEISAALSKAECESIIDDAAELGFTRIQFTGGDPLLCKFLPELVERAQLREIATREIYTNGLALSPALLDRLAPLSPCFAFSFYSHDPAIHDGITNTPGSYERTTDAIVRTLCLGLSARVAVIAMPENADDLEETLEYLRTLGVQSVSSSGTFGVGRGSHFEPRAAPTGNAHGGGGGPGRITGKLCVTYEGKVVPCIFNRDMELGDIRDRRLIDIAVHPDHPRKSLATREQFLSQCGSDIQCASCKLTACALHALPRAAT